MRSAVCAPPYPDADIDGIPGGELIRVPRSRPANGYHRTRILIASPQPIVRHGLRALLTAEKDFDVVAEAADGGSAVTQARRLRPDVVVIDLQLPDMHGLVVTRTIRSEVADTHIIVMAGADDDGLLFQSIRAGASAYVLKSMRTDAVVRAIRGAADGHVTLPSNAVARLARVDRGRDTLSERETDVLRLVARGQANKQIARELGIAQSTVKSHVGSLLDKLGLGSRTQLAVYAVRTGLVALDRDEATDEQPKLSGAHVASQPSAWPLQFALRLPATQA